MIQFLQYNPRTQQLYIQHARQKARAQKQKVVLETCQRFEIYAGDGFVNSDVAQHLFKVVSGIDSIVTGDSSVQHQVKKAYINACEKERLDPVMHRLFQRALHVGKKVRTQTHISQGAVSYAQAAVNSIVKANENKNARIVVLGVNKLSVSIIKQLQKKGFANIVLLNRSSAKAEKTAKELNISSASLDEKYNYLPEADVLVGCISSPISVIRKEYFKPERPLQIIDFGVPANVDAFIAHDTHVKYVDVKAMEKEMMKVGENRAYERKLAQKIIEKELSFFMEWQLKRLENFAA